MAIFNDLHTVPNRLRPLAKHLRRWKLENKECIYFLILASEIVYVGKTARLEQRLNEHRKDNKLFDDVLYLPVKGEVLAQAERELIGYFEPATNKTPRKRQERIEALVEKTALLDTGQAADFLRMSPRTLEKWRVMGGGPTFRKHGKNVFYDERELLAWSLMSRHQSTSESEAQL
jgi:hypothetical protein